MEMNVDHDESPHSPGLKARIRRVRLNTVIDRDAGSMLVDQGYCSRCEYPYTPLKEALDLDRASQMDEIYGDGILYSSFNKSRNEDYKNNKYTNTKVMPSIKSVEVLNEGISDKQVRILAYLREHATDQTYFKSRLIAEELGLSAKEVGTNMPVIQEAATDLQIEKWGYSSGTTWKLTTVSP